jgi:hypothetical protein
MRLRSVAVGLLTATLWAQTSPAPEAQVITGRVSEGGHTMQYLTDLTDKFGPRLTGSGRNSGNGKSVPSSNKRSAS